MSKGNQSLDGRELSPHGIIFCNWSVGSNSLKLCLKQTCDSPLNLFYSNTVSGSIEHEMQKEKKKKKTGLGRVSFVWWHLGSLKTWVWELTFLFHYGKFTGSLLHIKITYFHLLISEFYAFCCTPLLFQKVAGNEKSISPDLRNYYDKCENSILGKIVCFQKCEDYPYIFSFKMPNFSFELLNFSGFNTIWDDKNTINLNYLTEEISIFCWVFTWSYGCKWENEVPVWHVRALFMHSLIITSVLYQRTTICFGFAFVNQRYHWKLLSKRRGFFPDLAIVSKIQKLSSDL